MIKNPPIIKKAVKEMGGSIEEIMPERGCYFIKLKGKKIFVGRKFAISRDLITGSEVTKFKDITYLLLKQNNLPTPRTLYISRKNIEKIDLKKELGELKFPIIIKNAAGSNSVGIFANIKNFKEAKKILVKELKNYSRLIAQEMVYGREYRILILNDKVIGALELIPPRVIGNGRDTVGDLIREKQKTTNKKTPIDNSLKSILKEQKVSLNTVPAPGQFIYIRRNSSLAEGGETKDVTDQVNTGIEKMCAKASEVVERYLAGIDIMCEDISLDPKKQDFNIIEINGKPDIYIHYKPSHGKTRDVAKDIINFILKMKK
jgi:cyanophycin synthetase